MTRARRPAAGPRRPGRARVRPAPRALATLATLAMLAALAALAAAARPARAQVLAQASPPIAGRVVDSSGAALPLVRLQLDGVVGETRTDTLGRFIIPAPRPGHYTLRATRVGFRPTVLGIEVPVAPGTQLVVSMVVVPAALDSQVVTAASLNRDRLEEAGFFQRRGFSHGVFLEREAIDQRKPRNVSDVLRTVPGVRVSATRMVGGRNDGRGNPCSMRVYIDGMPLPLYGRSIDDYLVVSDIAGMEIYLGKGDVPPQYDDVHSDCGVILVWTRIQ